MSIGEGAGPRRPSPKPTGATVVYFQDDCDGSEACSQLDQRLGHAPVRSRDLSDLNELSLSLRRDGGVYFDEFRIAVIDPVRFGVSPTLLDDMRGDARVRIVRPEYYVHTQGLLSGFWRWLGFGAEQEATTAAAARGVSAARGATARSGSTTARAPDQPGAAVPAPAPSAPTMAATTWGLQAVGATETPLTGAGIRVAVLDTGVDLSHPDFADRVIEVASFVEGDDPSDGHGHGTHVAGTAVGPRVGDSARPGYGVAPDALLYVGKVLDDSGSGPRGRHPRRHSLGDPQQMRSDLHVARPAGRGGRRHRRL